MRLSIINLQNAKHVSQKTFGELLQSSKTSTHQNLKLNKPPGYDILETKFNNQLFELGNFFQKEAKKNQYAVSKDQLLLLLDKYVSPNSSLTNSKKFNNTQKKMLMQAYAKAGKKINLKSNNNNNNGADLSNRIKLTLLLKRNWPFLSYLVKQKGIEIKDEEESNEDWGFEEELEENEKKDSNTGRHSLNKNEGKNNDKETDTDFNSFLKKLNKVHQTPSLNVLPTMTAFEANPIISSIEIKDSEVKEFQAFLDDAKKQSVNRDELLFKAETNMEWSSNLLRNQPRLENKTFFLPICIPKTLIPIEQNDLNLVDKRQLDLKKLMKNNEFNVNKYDIMKIYFDGTSTILNNNNNNYWSGSIENFYTILSRLQHPDKFKKQLHKYLKLGWTPVSSDEKDILVVRNRRYHIITIIKRSSIISLIGLVLGYGIFSFTDLHIYM